MIFFFVLVLIFVVLSYIRSVHDMTSQRKLKASEVVDDKQEMPPKKSRLSTESGDKYEDSAHSTRTSRGRTHLDRLSVQKGQGIRREVQFDSKGRPIGQEAAKLQSYVGILAREKVKITYDTWKKVPAEVKEMIWESVNVSFIIY